MTMATMMMMMMMTMTMIMMIMMMMMMLMMMSMGPYNVILRWERPAGGSQGERRRNRGQCYCRALDGATGMEASATVPPPCSPPLLGVPEVTPLSAAAWEARRPRTTSVASMTSHSR